MTQTPRDKPQPPRPGPLPLYLQRRIDWLMRCRTWTINYLTDIRLEELGIVRVDHGAGTTHLVEAIATGPAA